jgi:peptidoglycan/xylan/chitin deacetylase (PgdA/CDA1 family)
MRIVSPLLKRVVYPTAQRIGWLDRIMPPAGYGVVNYHGVVPNDHSDAEPFLDGNLVQPEVFRKQLQFLKAHYCVIHPEEFREWIDSGKPLPERAVLITCDDGLLNTLTDMLSILRGEDLSCLFFVTGASCGDAPGMLWYEELYRMMRAAPVSDDDLQLPREEDTPDNSAGRNAPENFQARWWNIVRRASRLETGARADWMKRLRSQFGSARRSDSSTGESSIPKLSSEKRWRLLNISELRRLADAGMSIGAHTISHPILSLCSEEEARREIQESKTLLERALGRTAWAFAYPFGNPATMGEREVSLATDAGFACGFLNVEHWHDLQWGPLALPRTHVSMNTTLPEFAAHLSGLHARLQRAMGG